MAPPSYLILLVWMAPVVCARRASAQERLPYAVRTLSFSGLGTSVHGDLRTIGMGGASAGLADTFIAAVDSPAGLAMTVGAGDIHYATDSIQDKHIQSFDTVLHTESVGLALGLYPWAIGIGYLQPYVEQAQYSLPSLIPTTVTPGVITRELVLSAARLLFHDRLSIGASLVLGQAVRELQDPALRLDQSYASYTMGAVAGVMARLPRRVLLGTSFALPMHYAGAQPDAQQNLLIPGYFQSVEVPWRLSVGLGFIPSRFFRADLTLHLFGATPNTALVRDQTALVGQGVTLQPRLGAAYVFVDYKELRGTIFLGTYLEWSRIGGVGVREHGTGGLEARLWIFTIDGGVDFAPGYQNVLIGFGVDIFGVLARLQVIPTPWIPPRGGMFPRAYQFSSAGLPRPLVDHWRPEGYDTDTLKSAIGIPGKLGVGFKNAGKELETIGNLVEDALEEQKKKLEQDEAEALAREKRQRLQHPAKAPAPTVTPR